MSTTTEVNTPVVGMGGSIHYWSDSHACTIIEVSKSGKTVVTTKDIAKRIDSNGMSTSQKYEFTPNPDGVRYTFTLRKNGRWVQEGESMRGGTVLTLTGRYHYHDFSF